MRAARLLFPAIRWSPNGGFDSAAPVIERSLELGVGGFILFGGPAEEVAELVSGLQRRSPHPLLIGADLERGAGQQFTGATSLPPQAALGELDDLDTTRRAGELTGREARAVGVNWVYAPVADLDAEPRNPIVGSRAFGSDARRVSAHVVAWISGCRTAGALACAKHFPGHGRTTADSHLALPVVDADRETLDADRAPFAAAIRAGVDSIMTAHVAYPALDASGEPATLSRSILTGILRGELRFTGLIVTDALVMEGVLEGGRDEAAAAVAAVAAGCDALLYPAHLDAVAEALDSAASDRLTEARIGESAARIDAAARRITGPPTGEWARAQDRDWALEIADRSLRIVRGRPRATTAGFDVVTVDDDLGGPFPPGPRDAFGAALADAGFEVRAADEASADRAAIVAVYADIRGWKGRPGLSEPARAAVARAVDARPDAPVVLFGHPRLAPEVAGAHVLAAWGGEPLMQEAAARWLARTA